MHRLIEEELSTMQEAIRFPLSLHRMCELVEIGRSHFYRQRSQRPRWGLTQEVILRDQIQRIVLEVPGYGYRRVTKQLQRQGYQVNHKRVLRLMREDNLLCLRKRRPWVPVTTNSRHRIPCYPNLVPELHLSGIDQLWVADITYVRLAQQFLYLAVILDAYSRRVIGWALEEHLDARLTVGALQMALSTRHVKPGLVHHSDRGVQYACDRYIEVLKVHDIRISMSRKANPYDNAKAESFIKTLKAEEVNLCEYQSKGEAKQSIGHFLEQVYNQRRLHSSLGYLPPVEFEENLASREKLAKSEQKLLN